uniref:Uncharacterized protein n=1 Tax=Candidatus Desulfatibia profunda TaxID=2841695 RepID=A0A8J6TK18_9BACT|nr:hypothetical protein [Candidatus Desulfatibia profunda]
MPTIKPENNKQETVDAVQPITVSNTPTSFTDRFIIAKALDGSILLRLISDIPDARIENHRTVIKESLAKQLIEILCEITEYYPQKPKKATSNKIKMAKQSKNKAT